MSEERMGAWMTLLQAHAAVLDGLEDRLRTELGLPLSWHEVLVQLEGSPEGKLSMRELAGSVLLSKSGVSRLVDRMHEAGLVRRMACASDRRIVYAALTAKGRRTLRAALPVFASGFQEHFARHVTDVEARTLRSSLRKVHAAHGGLEDPRCPSPYLPGMVRQPADTL